MKKIFVFIDYYLPGYKFGGPLRTIANMVERLSDHFQFFIFTYDRDEGDTEPYSSVEREQWTHIEKAKVFYTADRSLQNILCRIDEVSPDIVYLNSFFSRVSVKVLLARKSGKVQNIPVLLAPRGEFAPGALMIKPWRKKFYISLVNVAGLLRDVSLHASTDYEKNDIERHLRKDKLLGEPMVASDLSEVKQGRTCRKNPKNPGSLRLIFLSRVIENKNLDGALRMLPGLSGNISLSIFGPIGNDGYWKECQQLISEMPKNVSVEYRGMLEHDKVHQAFSEHDLLLLPTLGENYGHVILESMMAGCPVLISDRTPWRDLEKRGVGADIPLNEPQRFQEFLQMFADMDEATLNEWSQRAVKYGIESAQAAGPIEQNLRMFNRLLKHAEPVKAGANA